MNDFRFSHFSVSFGWTYKCITSPYLTLFFNFFLFYAIKLQTNVTYFGISQQFFQFSLVSELIFIVDYNVLSKYSPMSG